MNSWHFPARKGTTKPHTGWGHQSCLAIRQLICTTPYRNALTDSHLHLHPRCVSEAWHLSIQWTENKNQHTTPSSISCLLVARYVGIVQCSHLIPMLVSIFVGCCLANASCKTKTEDVLGYMHKTGGLGWKKQRCLREMHHHKARQHSAERSHVARHLKFMYKILQKFTGQTLSSL